MKNDFPLFRRQFPKWNVRPDAHRPANVRHERPHERVPGRDRPFVDRQRLVRDQCRFVHRADRSDPVAFPARPLTVEREFLGAGSHEFRAADRALDFQTGRDVQARLRVVAVGAAVRSEAGKHQPQTVQKFRSGSESTADPRDPGPLMERQRGGNVKNFIDLGLGRLGHSPPGVGREGFQVPPRPFRVQNAQRQRGFSRAGNPRHRDDLIQRNVQVNILQIVYPSAADLNGVRSGRSGHFAVGKGRLMKIKRIMNNE